MSLNRDIEILGGAVIIRMDGRGIEKYKARIEQVDTQGRNMRPMLQRFGDHMLTSIARNFAAEGRPKRWAKLAERTTIQRRRLGFGAHHPILWRTGNMARGFYADASNDRLRIDNDIHYWRFHQTGTRYMPARPPVLMQRQDRGKFTTLLKRHLYG